MCDKQVENKLAETPEKSRRWVAHPEISEVESGFSEEVLRQTQERLHHVVNSNPAVIYLLEVQEDAFAFSWVSDSLTRMTGFEAHEALKPNWWAEHIHPDDRCYAFAQKKALLESDHLVCEYRFRRKAGSYLWIRDEARLIRDAGRRAEIVGSWSDITERKKTEEALKASHEYARNIIESSMDMIITSDSSRRITTFNRAAQETFGYASEEVLGKHIDMLYADPEEGLKIHNTTEVSGRHVHEASNRRKNGEVFPCLVAASTLCNAHGERVGFMGISRDITEFKRAEEERRRLSLAVEQAAESILITEPDGAIVYVNPAFERTSGYKREEVVGKNPRILKSEKHDASFYQEMWSTITKGEVWSGRLTNKHKDGSLFEEYVAISPMRDPSGKIVNYVAVKRDVTQEVALEAQLRQTQKLEAVGTLAGGVAHDFNNILTSIIGYAQLALMDENLSPSVKSYIAKIPEQGKQAARLISQLLTFSRRAITQRQPLSLLPLVKETLKMLERTVPENIEIQLEAPGPIATVNADPTQIQQMLLNLCINASHAMPNGGSLTIALDNVSLDEIYCKQHLNARPGDYIRLSVRDTGTGMAPEVMEHIFEPFFTTKEAGKGTGLGLAMVYGTVKEHEGHITVYSEVGKGSEFKVYFPTVKGFGTPEETSYGQPPRGTETLLLVEDQDTVLTIGCKMLEALGYTVLKATNGIEALKIFSTFQSEINLVLSDVVMPNMGGQELYEALVKIDPAVKVLLMSGYSLKQEVSQLEARGLKGFVQKPFDLNQLGRSVRQALDEKK